MVREADFARAAVARATLRSVSTRPIFRVVQVAWTATQASSGSISTQSSTNLSMNSTGSYSLSPVIFSRIRWRHGLWSQRIGQRPSSDASRRAASSSAVFASATSGMPFDSQVIPQQRFLRFFGKIAS